MRLKELEVESIVVGLLTAILVWILGAPVWAVMGFGIVATLATNKGKERKVR